MANTNLAIDPRGLGTITENEISILVLDDDEFDRKRLRRLASELPFPTKVDEANDLASLRTMLDAHEYDVILIDHILSSGDGIEALVIINTHRSNRNSAQIMVAGDPRYNIAVQAMKQGCDDFVAKDRLDADTLQQSILDALVKNTHSQGKDVNLGLQQLADSMSASVTGLCLSKIRPMVSRMMRQTHLLSEHADKISKDSISAIQTIEQSCGLLWNFLEEGKKEHARSSGKVVPIAK